MLPVEASRANQGGAVAVTDDYYQRAENGTDRRVPAEQYRHGLPGSSNCHSDDPGQQLDRASARSQAGLCLSAGLVDAGQSPAATVGLPQKGRSAALPRHHSPSRHPQVIRGGLLAPWRKGSWKSRSWRLYGRSWRPGSPRVATRGLDVLRHRHWPTPCFTLYAASRRNSNPDEGRRVS